MHKHKAEADPNNCLTDALPDSSLFLKLISFSIITLVFWTENPLLHSSLYKHNVQISQGSVCGLYSWRRKTFKLLSFKFTRYQKSKCIKVKQNLWKIRTKTVCCDVVFQSTLLKAKTSRLNFDLWPWATLNRSRTTVIAHSPIVPKWWEIDTTLLRDTNRNFKPRIQYPQWPLTLNQDHESKNRP